MQQPWLDVQLADVDGKVRVTEDVARQIPVGAEVRRVGSATGTILDLLASDAVDNTDDFSTYAEKNRYFARQSGLRNILSAEDVQLVWLADDGKEHTTSITPRTRGLANISVMFWLTLFEVNPGFERFVSSIKY